jgi:hypothetical protein
VAVVREVEHEAGLRGGEQSKPREQGDATPSNEDEPSAERADERRNLPYLSRVHSVER